MGKYQKTHYRGKNHFCDQKPHVFCVVMGKIGKPIVEEKIIFVIKNLLYGGKPY